MKTIVPNKLKSTINPIIYYLPPAGNHEIFRNRGIRILALSIFSIAFIYLVYSSLTSSENPQTITPKLYGIAQLVIILTVICVIFGVYGICLVINSSAVVTQYDPSMLSYTARIFRNRIYLKLFVMSSILYGLLFAYLSRILIYIPPEVSLGNAINYPSFVLTVCCGSAGYFPMLTISLTENLSVLLIPLNLILVVSVSLLVGFNIALSVYAFQLARSHVGRKIYGFFTMGAFSGLFIGCPTCAGTVIGSSFGIRYKSPVSVLAPFQTAFILMCLPILVLISFLLLRNIRNNEKCKLEDRQAE